METPSPVDGFKEFLRLERNYSDHTVQAYLSDLQKFQDQLGEKHVRHARPEEIRDFIRMLHEMGVSISTQARTVSSLKAFYRYLVQEELIEEDPSSLIEMPRPERKIPDVLSPEEIDGILRRIDPNEANGSRNQAIIEILYGCGLRVSEAVGLRISDLHFDEGFVRIRGKGGKERLVPMGRSTQEAIDRYLRMDRKHREAAHRNEDVLFLNRAGRALSRVMVFNIVREAARDAGIKKKVSPHTFRHSFATHLVEGGADLMAVREMLGHASVTTTEIYSHLNRQYLEEELIHHHPRSSVGKREEGGD